MMIYLTMLTVGQILFSLKLWFTCRYQHCFLLLQGLKRLLKYCEVEKRNPQWNDVESVITTCVINNIIEPKALLLGILIYLQHRGLWTILTVHFVKQRWFGRGNVRFYQKTSISFRWSLTPDNLWRSSIGIVLLGELRLRLMI